MFRGEAPASDIIGTNPAKSRETRAHDKLPALTGNPISSQAEPLDRGNLAFESPRQSSRESEDPRSPVFCSDFLSSILNLRPAKPATVFKGFSAQVGSIFESRSNRVGEPRPLFEAVTATTPQHRQTLRTQKKGVWKRSREVLAIGHRERWIGGGRPAQTRSPKSLSSNRTTSQEIRPPQTPPFRRRHVSRRRSPFVRRTAVARTIRNRIWGGSTSSRAVRLQPSEDNRQ